MDDTLGVGVVQRVGDVGGDSHRLVDAQLGLAIELVAEGLALDVGHDIEENGERRTEIGGTGFCSRFPVLCSRLEDHLARVKQRQDVRVLQCGGRLDLVHEPLGAEDGGEFGLEHLDRDLALVLEVLGEVDGGHAALAELALDRVAVGQGGPEPFETH